MGQCTDSPWKKSRAGTTGGKKMPSFLLAPGGNVEGISGAQSVPAHVRMALVG
jgi:hypothetical protein